MTRSDSSPARVITPCVPSRPEATRCTPISDIRTGDILEINGKRYVRTLVGDQRCDYHKDRIGRPYVSCESLRQWILNA